MSKLSNFLFSALAAGVLAIAPLQAHTAYGADLPACTIQGTTSSETLTGTEGADVICTGGGNDTINALGGDDIVIVQGGGTVTADLGYGDDSFYGGIALVQYHAIVHGGEGDDMISGTPGDDFIYGDGGDDTVYGGDGIDSIYGGYGNDKLLGDKGDDKITGEAGDDDINGGWGADNLDGAAGNDTLLGGFGNDSLYGDVGYDYLQGDAGDDNLAGESGTDSISGGEGDDIVSGGDGTDTLEGGWGLNLCDYSTGEIKNTTCRYDDTAPVIVSATWDKSAYETGAGPITIGLNMRITDEVAVRNVEVECSPFNHMTNSFAGFQTDVSFKLTQTLPKGTKPGIYDCYAWGYDQVNNYFSQKIASLQLTRAVGDWDDDAPVLQENFWSPPTYDVSTYAQTGYLNLHITDRTGLNNISLQCDDLWAWAYNLGTNLNNPSLASYSGTAKDFTGVLKLEIPYGHKPGSFQCNMWLYDKNNNLRYLQAAPLVITRDYGTWDEQAPVVEYGTWNQSKFDAGQAAQTALLSMHITDQSGVKHLYVSCAGVVYTPLYNLNVAELASNPAIAYVSGDRKDLYLTFSNTILLGQYPGKYPCSVWGVDDFGNSFWTNVDPLTVWRTPPGMPNEPTDFAYEVTNASSGVLTWTAPSFKGSPALKDYVIQYSTDNRETWKTIKDGYSTTPRLPISNLIDNTDYTFRIRGENGGGIDDYTSQYMDLAWTYLDVHTPEAVTPDAPTDLKVTNVTKSGFQLNWTAPTNDGGADITDFVVELSRNGGATWVSAKQDASTSQQLTVTGAAPGTTYLVRISTVNKKGASGYLTGSVSTLATNASKPQNVRVESQAPGRVVLNWDLPTTNGGAGITDYKVEVTSGTTWTTINHTPSNSLSYTITGVQKGKTYKVRVTAVTSLGLGDVSDILTFTADTTAPGTPTNLVVSGVTKSSAVLNWTTPGDTGGLAVSDYVIEVSSDNGYSWTTVEHTASNSTKFTINKLFGTTTYLVRVSAKNATGVGEATYETFTTPAGSPTAPRNLSGVLTDTGATLSWVVPIFDNGAAITDFKVEVSNDGGTKWVAIDHTAFVGEGYNVTGLKAGTLYKFRISAVNTYGAGDLSNVIELLTPGAAPAAPTALKVTTKTTTTVALSWNAAKVVGGSPVREYIVEYSKNRGATWTRVSSVAFKSLSLTVKGFKSKTSYLFRVSARNDVGVSANSNTVNVATR
jgi:hypothetical protein